MKHTFETEVAERKLRIETGTLAAQANGSIMAQYGETVLLATAVIGGERTGIDYFPLTVDYDEKLYAAGRIKGSRWVKREGRPTDEAILSGRLVDRAIRPRFDHTLRRDVQIILTILSFDNENDPDILSLIGASAALMASNIPWNGPVAAVRIAYTAGEWFINPTYEERENAELDIVFAGTHERLNMIEAGGREAPEAIVLKAAELAHAHIREIVRFQETMVKELKPEKLSLPPASFDPTLEKDFAELVGTRLKEAVLQPDLGSRWDEASKRLREELIKGLVERGRSEEVVRQATRFFEEKLDATLHESILGDGKRPDGRAADELRPLSSAAGVLPRTHGSGLFQRGQTQALSLVTLGAPGLEQHLEGMEIVGTKRFMHHYNFPPFSTGETGRLQGPGRREIGHGALAERAIEPIIPPKETFPYTIRVVSEILSSNGSSSMASVCGSTLALMDAGVPITKPVAGVAMGLITDSSGKFKVLTDIQGPEDHHGDMDLKVAGTKEGITALQMDVKIEGITIEMLGAAIEQAKKARLEILESMRGCLERPRESLSPHAPRVFSIQINPQRIRDVIGPGGKTIHMITEQTGVTIDIEDSGLVFVTAIAEETTKPLRGIVSGVERTRKTPEEAARKALEWINNLTREIKEGEIFQGRVTRILDFGAIVELVPGQDGLVHISEMAPHRIDRVEDVVQVGSVVPVKVMAVHPDGKISLSMRALNEPEGAYGQRNETGSRGPRHSPPEHRRAGFSESRPHQRSYRPGAEPGRDDRPHLPRHTDH